MLYARSAMVIAAASAHVQAVDGVWVDLKDTEGLAAYGRQSRRLGFSAMSLIHPRRSTPSIRCSARHPRKSTTRNESSRHSKRPMRGDGSIAFGGQLIDRPIVERARRALELAKSLGILVSCASKTFAEMKMNDTNKRQLMKPKTFAVVTLVWFLSIGAAAPAK